jgi:hypothetical protein
MKTQKNSKENILEKPLLLRQKEGFLNANKSSYSKDEQEPKSTTRSISKEQQVSRQQVLEVVLP